MNAHIFHRKLRSLCSYKHRIRSIVFRIRCRCRQRECYSGRRESSMREVWFDERYSGNLPA